MRYDIKTPSETENEVSMKTFNTLYRDPASFMQWVDTLDLPSGTPNLLVQVFSGCVDPDKIEEVATQIMQRLPHAVLIGSTTSGEILDGQMHEQNILVSISRFEKSTLKSAVVTGEPSYESGRLLAGTVVTDETRCVIMFADGIRHNGDQLLKGFTSVAGSDIVVAGGMSGDNLAFESSYLIHAGALFENSVVAASINSSELQIFHTYNLSWNPLGRSMTVTKSEGGRVYEIDNRPLPELYAKYLGEPIVAKMPESTVEFPLIFTQNGVSVARSMINVFDDGSALFAGDIPQGSRVKFGIGNSMLIEQSTMQSYSLAQKVPLESLFIYSCAARKAYLGETLENEFGPLAELAPMAGFFTYGEFYHGDTGNELLNITTTILGLSESSTAAIKHSAPFSPNKHRQSLSFSALSHLVETTTRELAEEVEERREKQMLLEQYKHAIDTILIVSKTDPSGKITYANEHFCDISGYSRDELIGKAHSIVRHPDMPETIFKEMWDTILSRRVWQGIIKNRRKNGSDYYVKSSIVPIIDARGDVTEFMGLREDVTDLVAANKVIESERDRTITILDQQESIVVLNRKGKKISHINQKFFETFPYATLGEFLQGHDCICELFVTEPGYLEPTTSEKHWTVPIFTEPDKPHKALMKDRWGALRTFSATVKPTILDDEEYYLATFTDITELEDARKRTEEAERSKSEFLANMSHEIRTPMNGIIGFTHLLKQSKLDEDQKRHLSIIESSSHTLLGIVNDILDFSKIESGKLELDLVCLNPFIELEPAFMIFHANTAEKEIDYRIDIDSGISECMVIDTLRLKQVMSNLIGNAVKFTPSKGSINVNVTLIEKREQGQRIRFSVKDSGIGIPKERQKAIFEAFSQADSSTTRKFGGTGLGLSISASLVSMMGGTLQVESEEGRGSTFFFELDVGVCDDAHHLADSLNKVCIGVATDSDRRYSRVQKQMADFKVPYCLLQHENLDESLRHKRCNIVILHDPKAASHLAESDATDHIVLISETGQALQHHPKVSLLDSYESCPSALYNLLTELKITDLTEAITQDGSTRYDLDILVAEDYPVNQILISELLTGYGITFDIASNGREAVEMASQKDYDLVLMDVNMPEMNGIEATEAIRRDHSSTLPIIALTANAMAGDRERFLAAGMNDYLTKPIDPKALQEVFDTYTSQQLSAQHESTECAVSAHAIEDAFSAAAASLGLSQSIIEKLFNQFFESAGSSIPALEAAHKTHDYTVLMREAHNIKGAASSLRLDRVAAMAEEIEHKASAQEAFDYVHHVKALGRYIDDLREQYQVLKG